MENKILEISFKFSSLVCFFLLFFNNKKLQNTNFDLLFYCILYLTLFFSFPCHRLLLESLHYHFINCNSAILEHFALYCRFTTQLSLQLYIELWSQINNRHYNIYMMISILIRTTILLETTKFVVVATQPHRQTPKLIK